METYNKKGENLEIIRTKEVKTQISIKELKEENALFQEKINKNKELILKAKELGLNE